MASAIKAIIATQFDNSGIKKATKEFGKLGSTVKGALGALGIGVGIAAISNGLKEASKAAIEDVKSQQLLANSLKNTLGANDAMIASVEDSIHKMQLASSVADDEIRPAFEKLAAVSGSVEEATSLTNMALDLAARKQISVGQAASAIAKAYSGQTTALTKLMPELKGSKNLFADLENNIKGAAEVAANADPYQRMQTLFGDIQEQIGMQLVPVLQEMANYFASTEGQQQLANFTGIVIGFVDAIKNAYSWVVENWKAIIQWSVGIGAAILAVKTLMFAFEAYTAIVNIAKTAQALFAIALGASTGNAVAIALGVAVIGASIAGIGIAAATAAGQVDIFNNAVNKIPAISFGPGVSAGTAPGNVANPKKGFTTTWLVSGQWYTSTWNGKAWSNPKKIAAPVTPTPSVGKTGETAAEKAQKKRLEALKKEREALIAFRKEMMSLAEGLSSLTVVSKDMGEFESSVVDTFDSINKKLIEGVANKTFAQKGLKALQDYLKAEQSLLLENAKQRDAIIEKRSLAESLYNDVKSNLLGVGNLSNLLDSETKQITTSVTRIVDGFSVTTKSIIEETVGAKGVLGRLKEVVAKTKAFALQLTDLKKLGLNKDLFSQIVAAGPEVGGQLATEILSGGKDSVKAINDTFADLEKATGDIAEQTTIVMYNAGVEVAGGLVAGLLSQEASLVAAAKKLADAFNAEYQAKLNALQIPSTGAVDTTAMRLGDIKLAGEAAGASAVAKANAALAAKLINTSQFTAWGASSIVNVTVNAGVGTNGKAVGQQLTSLLNQYAKSSAK